MAQSEHISQNLGSVVSPWRRATGLHGTKDVVWGCCKHFRPIAKLIRLGLRESRSLGIHPAGSIHPTVSLFFYCHMRSCRSGHCEDSGALRLLLYQHMIWRPRIVSSVMARSCQYNGLSMNHKDPGWEKLAKLALPTTA